jgi:hypothetical protein
MNTLSLQGKEAVRSCADFETARASDDLIRLRNIITVTHGLTYGVGTLRFSGLIDEWEKRRNLVANTPGSTDPLFPTTIDADRWERQQSAEFKHIRASLVQAGGIRVTESPSTTGKVGRDTKTDTLMEGVVLVAHPLERVHKITDSFSLRDVGVAGLDKACSDMFELGRLLALPAIGNGERGVDGSGE